MKLVRNGIPALVAAKGEEEPFRQVVDDDEHDTLLDAKFDEELAEWRENFDPEELADLLGVVRDTAVRQGIGWSRLLEMEEGKRRRYGSFLGGVVWLGEKVPRYDNDANQADSGNDLPCHNCGASLSKCFADPPCCRTENGKHGCLHGG